MPASASKATMCALPEPWAWSERSPDGTQAAVRLAVDLGASHMSGHYPGHPILPGVVVMDWVAQAVDALHGGGLRLRRVERARFIRPLLPGDVLELTVRVLPREPEDAQRETREGIAARARFVRSDGRCAAELDAVFEPVVPCA
ncbi:MULTISPECIES: 3-hydroxyacyl-ACP dehydratase FabZ family protein [Streptomyces]|uniref:3-hydroxyacyl-ACP dehydratase FabZ family protein n=1 Tax=Streptomyces TaxID=1883 RepID=UPI00345C2AE6